MVYEDLKNDFKDSKEEVLLKNWSNLWHYMSPKSSSHLTTQTYLSNPVVNISLICSFAVLLSVKERK